MPRGMFLRSSPSASNIADPDGQLRLDRYHALHSIPDAKPRPLEDFVRYGQWFQQQVVPDVDRRTVTHVAANALGFHVRLEDGEEFHARRVVVATGISPFARRPPQFAGLPAPLVSHSFDHGDLPRCPSPPAALLRQRLPPARGSACGSATAPNGSWITCSSPRVIGWTPVDTHSWRRRCCRPCAPATAIPTWTSGSNRVCPASTSSGRP